MTEIKKVPMRMCIVCRNMVPKKELLRIVKTPDGQFMFDATLRANGRGAYVCDNSECVEKCLKKKLLHRAFKENISEEIYKILSEEYEKRKNI